MRGQTSNVLPLTNSISNCSFADAKPPILHRFQGVDLDEIGMLEHLADAKFMFGLVEKLLFLRAVNGDNLEGVILAVGGAADVENLAMGAGTECADHLELADLHFAHEIKSLPLSGIHEEMIPRDAATYKGKNAHEFRRGRITAAARDYKPRSTIPSPTT